MNLNSDIYKKTHYLIIHSQYIEKYNMDYIRFLTEDAYCKNPYCKNPNKINLVWSTKHFLPEELITINNIIIMEDKFDINLFYTKYEYPYNSEKIVFGEKTKKKYPIESIFYKKYPHCFEIIKLSEKKFFKNNLNNKTYGYYIADIKIPIDYNIYNKHKITYSKLY